MSRICLCAALQWFFTSITYVYALFVFFVRLYPINSKRLNRSGQKNCWYLAWPQERFMDDRIFKNLPLTPFYFLKFEKSTKCSFINPRQFLFVCTQRATSNINFTDLSVVDGGFQNKLWTVNCHKINHFT